MSSEPLPNDPDVTVDELLRRVRQEVERRRLGVRMRGAAAPTVVDEQTSASWRALGEAIAAAEPSATVGMRLPPMTEMRGWRRRIAVPVARVILRAAQLVTRDQIGFNRLLLDLLRMLTSTSQDQMAVTAGQVGALTDGVAQALAQSSAVSELLDAGARSASEIRALRESVGGLEDRYARIETGLAELQRLLEQRRADEDVRRGEQARILSSIDRRVTMLAAAPPPAVTAGPDAPAARCTDARLPDTFYLSFEDRFRGTRDDVKGRLAVYLPIVTDAGAGTAARPILDVGSGRGEWLEVLAGAGLVARGIDLNDAMVAESRALGLDATSGDALAHVRALPDASLGAITGMHVVEHLEFAELVELLEQCARVLHPGGVAIFETPNPQNLLVGACQFYVDPSHQRPLHPDTMTFVAEHCGLSRVRILPLHPIEDGRRLADGESPSARTLNAYLFGPQDFALVAYRA
jgi:2-polyprenyl-3-methyl-5-hydroxy-6-metoxy-1,4-benzoquinol methylase